MKITEASESDIREMVNRLNKRQSDRKAQNDMEEAVRMVQNRPFVAALEMQADNFDSIVIGIDSILYMMIALFGALYWNLSSNIYGILLSAYSLFLIAISNHKAEGLYGKKA